MSRCIDADALEKEGWSLHRTIRVDMNTEEYQTKPLKQVPTIEPERKKGKWIYDEERCATGIYAICSACDESIYQTGNFRYCPNCGADMRDSVETARDIVHEAVNNSVWSDTVDTAKMHNVVDDKYVEMTKKTEESKRCDTCKHEKSRWFSRCADCSDYELWEGKDETGRTVTKKETPTTGRGGSRTRTGSIEDGQSNLRRYAGYLR